MAIDANGVNPPATALQIGSPGDPALPLQDAASAADVFSAIGYEAADPALHAPLWAEAIQAGATPKNLR